jgi:hypothetical protein
MEEILGREAFDGDDLGPLPMDEQLPEKGERCVCSPTPSLRRQQVGQRVGLKGLELGFENLE